MLRVFYYYYYLFYQKINIKPDAETVAPLALTFSEALLVIYTVDLIYVHLFCDFLLNKWGMAAIWGSIWIINYFYLERSGLAEKIVKEKPKLLGSHRLSIVVTLLFFLFSISLLFWMADYLLFVIENC